MKKLLFTVCVCVPVLVLGLGIDYHRSVVSGAASSEVAFGQAADALMCFDYPTNSECLSHDGSFLVSTSDIQAPLVVCTAGGGSDCIGIGLEGALQLNYGSSPSVQIRYTTAPDIRFDGADVLVEENFRVGSSGECTIENDGDVTATSFTATATAGNNAFAITDEGARMDLGPGTTDYLYACGDEVCAGHNIKANAVDANYYTANDAGSPVFLQSKDASDGSAAAFQLVAITELTTTNDQLMTIKNGYTGSIVVQLDKDGMLQLGIGNTDSTPTCDATQRGKIWIVEGGSGVADTVEICTKDGGDAYAWRTLL